MSLEQLLAGRADLWRGRAAPTATPAGVPTGYPALDLALPWRGWPPVSLSEVLDPRPKRHCSTQKKPRPKAGLHAPG
jgi:hypothetical protein